MYSVSIVVKMSWPVISVAFTKDDTFRAKKNLSGNGEVSFLIIFMK
jgi:hypothetical protein